MYVFMLGYVINALKKIPLEYIFISQAINFGIANMLNFALVYASQINFYVLFGIMFT